jgi:hypothetical protein
MATVNNPIFFALLWLLGVSSNKFPFSSFLASNDGTEECSLGMGVQPLLERTKQKLSNSCYRERREHIQATDSQQRKK